MLLFTSYIFHLYLVFLLTLRMYLFAKKDWSLTKYSNQWMAFAAIKQTLVDHELHFSNHKYLSRNRYSSIWFYCKLCQISKARLISIPARIISISPLLLDNWLPLETPLFFPNSYLWISIRKSCSYWRVGVYKVGFVFRAVAKEAFRLIRVTDGKHMNPVARNDKALLTPEKVMAPAKNCKKECITWYKLCRSQVS